MSRVKTKDKGHLIGYFGAKTTADNASHFMTHDPRDQSLTRVTHDSRLLTSHCHSVTFRTLGRGKGVSMRFNSISYCAYMPSPLDAQ